jgi:hypothetical protein
MALRFKTHFPGQILLKTYMIKTLLHQYLLHLGLENFFSHHYLYQKTFQILLLFSKFGGHPYTVPLIDPVNL